MSHILTFVSVFSLGVLLMSVINFFKYEQNIANLRKEAGNVDLKDLGFGALSPKNVVAVSFENTPDGEMITNQNIRSM